MTGGQIARMFCRKIDFVFIREILLDFIRACCFIGMNVAIRKWIFTAY